MIFGCNPRLFLVRMYLKLVSDLSPCSLQYKTFNRNTCVFGEGSVQWHASSRVMENELGSMIPRHSPEAPRIVGKCTHAKRLHLNLSLLLSALTRGPQWGSLACCSYYVCTAAPVVRPAGTGEGVCVFEMDTDWIRRRTPETKKQNKWEILKTVRGRLQKW